MVRQTDDQYHTHDHDDHLFPVDKFSAKGITKESKRQLTDDVTDVGGRVDSATKEERIGGGLDRWLG